MKKVPPLSIRQGDVLLLDAAYVGGKPAQTEVLAVTGKKVILALGEATGHHHRFEFVDTSHNVKLHAAHGGERFLTVEAPAELLHEEHETAPVPIKDYVLPRQLEYTPAALQQVAD